MIGSLLSCDSISNFCLWPLDYISVIDISLKFLSTSLVHNLYCNELLTFCESLVLLGGLNLVLAFCGKYYFGCIYQIFSIASFQLRVICEQFWSLCSDFCKVVYSLLNVALRGLLWMSAHSACFKIYFGSFWRTKWPP